MNITIPIRTVSEANQREHWATKNRRNKAQQWMVWGFMRRKGSTWRRGFPVAVTMTRVAPRKLDTDNLAGSFKHVQDAVAKWLGIDDGSDMVRWTYEQRRGKLKEYAVEVNIEALERARKGERR